MAELLVGGAFLSAALNVLFDRLASRQVVEFFWREKLGEGLLKKFEVVLRAVNVLLDDAEMKEFSNPGVKKWIDDLKDSVYHAEDLLDEIYTLATKPKTKKSIFRRRSKIKARTAEEIIEKINFIVSQKDLLGLSEGVRGNLIRRDPTTSLVEDTFIGRDTEKQKIIESLFPGGADEDEISVTAIVGMGGMGKTTLAKMVYNDEKVLERFPLRAWVCVTEEVDLFRLTKTILDSVTSCDPNITDLNLLQLKLKQELSGKKLLLVLDDVWDDNFSKWRKICAPFATLSSESRIIVTTRNNSVAMMMGAISSHRLDQLPDGASWELFKNHAFGKRTVDAYPHLEEIGKGIVKKCKGLPLAIKTLAGALRGKYDVKDWEMIMQSEIWDSSSIGNNDILPVLKLSYYYLPANIKRCFAYCSIFPQDYVFNKEKLVLLWMAEGFLVDKDNNMEKLGDQYFDELVSRSFFQISSSDHQTVFVMHDLMNDLAQYVSGEFCHAFQRSESQPVSEKVRHFSNLTWQSNVLDKNKHIVEAKNLRTILGNFSTVFLRSLLPELGSVRVLSLAGNHLLTELPDSIFSLVHLRYLDLSGSALKCLPNKICQLYNLQTLNLSNCYDLIKLPANLGELVNLRHLDIYETSLYQLPPLLGQLKSLQTLSTFIVGVDNCSRLGELNGLPHLKGSVSITGLHNVKNVEEVIEANLKGKNGIKQLSFEWDFAEVGVSNNHTDILDKLQPSAKLNGLALVGYGGTRFSNWLVDGSLSNLTRLKISNCLHCSLLPSVGQLPSLLKLHFQNMASVKRVDSDFYGNETSSVKPFRNLVDLTFEEMPEWEEWSPSGNGNNVDFPMLETLSIQNCPKLCGNLPKHLPSLHDLRIESYGELTIIIPGNASPGTLKLVGCKNVVLESTTNLNCLISLYIGGLQSNSFPIGMMEKCTNLEELNICNWYSLTHFPKETFHKFKHLETLRLFGCCDSMTCFPLGLFPNLERLIINSLRNLEWFSIEDEENHENLKSLLCLSILECHKLIKFPSGGLLTPNLNSLYVDGCSNLKWLPEGMNTQLTSLQYLIIYDCEQVESFPAGGLPSSLRCLRIKDCKKLMAKRRDWDLHTLSSLEYLEIGGCEDMESFPEVDWQLPTSITQLDILELPNLETIVASRLPPNLETLRINDCPKVKFNSKLRSTQDLPASFVELDITNGPIMAKQLKTRNRDLIPRLTIDHERQ